MKQWGSICRQCHGSKKVTDYVSSQHCIVDTLERKDPSTCFKISVVRNPLHDSERTADDSRPLDDKCKSTLHKRKADTMARQGRRPAGKRSDNEDIRETHCTCFGNPKCKSAHDRPAARLRSQRPKPRQAWAPDNVYQPVRLAVNTVAQARLPALLCVRIPA